MKEPTRSSEDPTPDFNGERAARRTLLWALGLLASLAALSGTWLFQKAQDAREPLATLPQRAPTPSQRAAQLLVAGEMARARKELMAALANTPDDPASLLVLACIELEENQHPEAQEVITRLRTALPERPEPKLLEMLLARELEELDALSTLPSWSDTSYTRTFQEARQHLRELEVPASTERALFVAGRSTGSSSALLLLRRAETTGKQLSEDERRWMGRMLWRIGTRLIEPSSYLEHTVGLLLMESGAEDLNDRCGESEASARQDELSASVLTSYKAALDRWPLPSLRREMEDARARHEVNWLLTWLGKTTLP